MQSFERLFHPRGVAVIGASTEPTRPGAQTVNALRQRGYAGAIHPVNPKYAEIQGLPAYARIEEVPQPCDVAVIALPAAQVPDTIAACGRRGVPFAVVLGGGFRETGPDGAALEARLKQVALASGVRVLGPNCLGFVNVQDRVYAGFGSLTRPPLAAAGGVSAVIQSGGFGNSLVMRCAAAGIGFRYVVASGNETDISAAELISACVDDPQTRVILAYLEGVADGRAFMHAARRALMAGKPLLVWKAGNTRQGSRAAASHTANMTGSYDIFRAAFKQCGVIEIQDVDDTIDCVLALLSYGKPVGRDVAVMGGSGGSAVVFSDAADRHGITLATLSAKTRQILSQCLPGIAGLDNPIDFAAGFLGVKNEARFLQAVEAVLADPGVDQLALMLATVVGESGASAARVLAQATRHGKPIFVFWAAPRDSVGDAYDILAQAGIPTMNSPARVAAAMGMLADYGDASRRNAHTPIEPAARTLPSWEGSASDERQSKQLLAAFSIPVTQDCLLPAAPPDETTAASLPYPVALKIVSPDIAHKTEVGGVRLNVTDAQGLRDAAQAMLADVSRAAPQARLTGMLACQMVNDGLETIVGVVRDEVFGPVVALGLGGIYAEALRDMTYRIAPFDLATAREMVNELRSAPLFGAVRGRPARDVEALAAVLVAVSELAWTLRERLSELDINPLLVRSEGQGVVAADALAVWLPSEHGLRCQIGRE